MLQVGEARKLFGKQFANIAKHNHPLSEEGRAFVDRTYAPDAFERDMAFWEDSMNHWLRSGEMLRAAARQS